MEFNLYNLEIDGICLDITDADMITPNYTYTGGIMINKYGTATERNFYTLKNSIVKLTATKDRTTLLEIFTEKNNGMTDFYIYNNVFINKTTTSNYSTRAAMSISVGQNNAYLYHNTFVSSELSLAVNSGNIVLKNNLFSNLSGNDSVYLYNVGEGATTWWGGAVSFVATNNSVTVSSANVNYFDTAFSNLFSEVFSFIDISADNYKINSGPGNTNIIGTAVNTTTDPFLSVTTDIAGSTRTSFDRGAFEH